MSFQAYCMKTVIETHFPLEFAVYISLYMGIFVNIILWVVTLISSLG